MNNSVRNFIEQKTLTDKVCVVVGVGKSGLAAARLLTVVGARVRIVDRNEAVTEDKLGELAGKVELITGPHKKEHFSDADLVVFSPGVPVPKLADVLEGLPTERIVSELEFASWFIEAPILAITGTNGKTTTTTLVSQILEDAGRKVFTGGNIGTPLCQHVLDNEAVDVVILEVSSFQLQNCMTFKPHVGVFLNFAPDHLDYHADMDEYLDAKLMLFQRMTGEDTALLHDSLRNTLKDRGFTNAHIEWFGPEDRFEIPYLPGEHNRSNAEAAWQAAKQFGVTEAQAAETIRNFKPLAHRIEPVGEKNGVLYVDDSKATTLDSVVAAVRTYDRPIRLLMGGVWKGGDVEAFAQEVKDRVVHVGLFGGSRDILEAPLSQVFPVSWDETLEDAVNRLAEAAVEGDVILLSPATASFDQYDSYVHRGNDFKQAVEALS
ncbi:UDP-N-acetylmuramoyl-L-alanine--D-glutamate ligase [Pseudodesulfovibrio sp. zrk46]|uniref:UDP-N-acetylmuramoyl-L-alanine--D-glutamate ligase n=1 Tax=Pseudodesulfovibrio sp. zrk46 TaxID=2725288 RepID=UPI0014499908|nr:UDP-N-acetylmuramoyl-L-alanine--D-glutamate ligase [Pseudodesulfovibrio sp. zrk46]QJB55398.1 UDP-N-acetylmuramoyl-L-alanine--D-glutamate ligase [Pseudodesulfovibrio sp. zrk46]